MAVDLTWDPGHLSFLYFADETTEITESTDHGVTPALLPSASALTKTLVAYIDPPSVTRNDNTKQGYAAGKRTMAYAADGALTYQMSINMRLGSIALLEALLYNVANPYYGTKRLALFYGQSGKYAKALRYAIPTQFVIGLQESTGEASEITVQATFEGIAQEELATAITVDPAAVATSAGGILTWHNVLDFEITGNTAASNATDYRKAFRSLQLTFNQNLERKNARPDWGNDEPLSRTSYGLLPHTLGLTGELGLHQNLEKALFTKAATARTWGNITVTCNDVGTGGTKEFNLVISDARPTGHSSQGGDVSGEITYSIPFIAEDVAVDDGS